MTVATQSPLTFGYRHYLLAATPFVVVFLIMPCELFFTQAEEWDVQPGQLAMVPLAGLLGWGLTSLLLAGLARWKRGVARGLALLLFIVGCYLLLADLYSPVQMNSLDGAALSSDEPLKYTLLELGIGLVLLVVLGLLLKGRGERVAGVFATLLVLAGFAYGGVVLAYMLTPEPAISSAEADTGAGSGNVYHVVLDRMQTDAFLVSVDRAAARPAFEGFELFSNNVSNYMITVPSRASYLSGTFYHEGNYKEWHKGIWRQQGIQKMLDEQGYRVWNYVPFRQWRDPSVDVFRYILDVYRDRTGIAGSSLSDFLVLWLLRPVPNALTNEALSPVAGARDLILAGMDRLAGASSAKGDRSKRLTMREGLQVVASKHTFEQAVIDEEKRAASGEYVYLHAVLPHLPYVLDDGCTYHGPPTRKLDEAERREAYLDQAVCSVRLIRNFLDHLRMIGRYDDATIIIHADTGAEEGFLDDPADYRSAGTTLGRADNQLLSGVNALLMIKRPGGRGPLREQERVTQLVDLFPSLADILELEDSVDALVHGRSIYATKDEPRDVRFGFDPDELFGSNFMEVRIETPEDIRRSKLTVVGPALTPANWRPEIQQITD
ncbi:MAG: sulfatase-like hydrolase/transferase [Geminicoccaceae bacterium]